MSRNHPVPVFLSVFCALLFCVLLHIHNHLCIFKFNMHLCHGPYWCTHTLAHMPIFLFYLHLHSCNSCLCVFKQLYALTYLLPYIYVRLQIYIHISTLMYIFSPLHTRVFIRIHIHLFPPSYSCVFIFQFLYVHIDYSCNNPYPLHPHKYVHMCVCLLQDYSK